MKNNSNSNLMYNTPPQQVSDYVASDLNLTKPIVFSPSYYDYAIKYQRKSRLLYLDSYDHLPRIGLSTKFAQKARLHQQQRVNKRVYGLTNQVMNKGTIHFDGVSYDTQEGYKRYRFVLNGSKLINDEMYVCLINYMFGASVQPASVLQALSSHIQESANVYQHNSMDLMYLNLFRVGIFVSEGSQGYKVNSFLYYPQLGYELSEIRQPNKLVETPLTRMITRLKKGSHSSSEESQKQPKTQYKFGFLTLDQSKRILPLMASDPIVFQLPLIGAWLYTNDQNEDILSRTQLIWTIITEFVTGQEFKSKITNNQQEKSFLFVLFQKYHSPMFFDTKVLKQPKSTMWKLVKQSDQVHTEDLESHIVTFSHAQTLKSPQFSDLLRSDRKAAPLVVSGKKRCQTQVSPPQMNSPEWADTHQKCAPKPTPLNNEDSNTSLTSATFVSRQTNQPEMQQLLSVYAEQIIKLQNQMQEMQKAFILTQSQQFFPQAQPPQYYCSPFYQKHSEPTIPMFNRVSVTAFPQMSNRSAVNSDSSGKPKPQLPMKPQEVDVIHQTFSNLPPQRLNFAQNDQVKSLTKHTDEDIEDLVKAIVQDEKISSRKKDPMSSKKQTVTFESTKVKPPEPKTERAERVEVKRTLTNLINSPVPQRLQTFTSGNKENVQHNIKPQESAQSSKMPKIKYPQYEEDSDTESEMLQKLEMKYLKMRR